VAYGVSAKYAGVWNLWWPTCLNGPPLGTDRSLEIDRIIY
jgi:hypothetical protein